MWNRVRDGPLLFIGGVTDNFFLRIMRFKQFFSLDSGKQILENLCGILIDSHWNYQGTKCNHRISNIKRSQEHLDSSQ